MTKSMGGIVGAGLLLASLFVTVSVLSRVQYKSKEALALSEEFIDLLWQSEYDRAYQLAIPAGPWGANKEDFISHWCEIYPEEKREMLPGYEFFNGRYMKSGWIHPYQSVGNYIKRRVLQRDWAEQQNITVTYYINTRKPLDPGALDLRCFHIDLVKEGDRWIVVDFYITAG